MRSNTATVDDALGTSNGPEPLPPGPVILVVDGCGPLSAEAARLCAWLGIATRRVLPGRGLAAEVLCHRPAAVIADVGKGGADGAALMQAVSLSDPGVPVMVGATGQPDALEQTAEAARRVRVSDLTCCEGMPGAEQVMGFLFKAGRRNGSGRLLPA